MKTKIFFLMIVSAAIVSSLFAQQVKYCQMIGKDVNDIIKVYGKPVHQDLSNPDMKCIFYQTKTSRTTFIAGKGGVYQIQADLSYDTEKEAIKSIDGFLGECGSQSYQIDTLSIGNYNIKAPGVKMSLNLFQNTYLKKYEVKFKAEKSETK
ncbi:MAG: hypothetical protein KGZ42_00260 [Melioribacter sp.]|nr:hypothetical protein [Melioribacter sp.]